MANDDLMDQDDIEKLLNQAKGDAPAETPESASQPMPGSKPADEALDQSEIESLLSGSGSPKPAAETAESDEAIGQDDIEQLLDQASDTVASTSPSGSRKSSTIAGDMPGEGELPQGDVDYLLTQAEEALASITTGATDELPQGVAAFRLEEFAGAPASTDNATLDLIRDVQLDLKIELGRTHMYLEDILKLRKGSVVPLDKLAGDPVDIYVNGRLIARGEVLVLNDNFCVRVAELIAGTSVCA